MEAEEVPVAEGLHADFKNLPNSLNKIFQKSSQFFLSKEWGLLNMFGTKNKALICGFIISVLFSFVGFSNKCEGISNKVFRLHIIANSDSAEDQNLKLKVRDRVLNDFASEFKNADDLISAEKITIENIGKIKDIVHNEINKNGYDYAVNVEVTHIYFNTRKYNETTLPAGYYDALRIIIGKGEGKNWWCVMFPPMCLPAAQEREELGTVLNPSELDVAQGWQRYKIQFKIVELIVTAKDFFKNRIWSPMEGFMDSESLDISGKYEMDFKLVRVFYEIKDFTRNI